MARLKPGWTAERAQAQLESISPGVFATTVPPRYNAETAKNYTAFKFTATPASLLKDTQALVCSCVPTLLVP